MLSYSVLFVAAVVAVVSARTPWDDPCTLYPVVDHTNNKKLSLEVPQNCTEGTINWDWPRGNLTVHLSLPGVKYELCLVKTSITLLGQLWELTGGVTKQIPLPTEGHDACTASVNGDTKFLVISATNQYYYSSNDYKVVSK